MSRCGKRPLFRLLLLLLATFCFEVCAAKGGEAANAASAPPPPPRKKRWRGGRPRRPCAENDAKCIALRDHECDPYFTNVTDKCTFVQYNRHCADDVHHINYLKLFYCRPPGDTRVLVALGFLLFMAVLFWTMSKVAEAFLVPALEFLAYWMRLAPDVAGVTLFAFASGAPDLFTQIAAVAAGATVDQELAIGATLGAGLFIIAVILSIVMLCSRPAAAAAADGGSEPAGGGRGGGECCSGGGNDEITDRRAFVRDAVAYLLSTLALLALMLRGTFTAWEAGLLLLGYGAYLAVCLWTSRGGGGARPGLHHRGYLPVSPSQAGGPGQALETALQLAEQQQQQHVNGLQRNSGNAAQLDGVVVASAVAGGLQGALPIPAPRAQVELVSRVGAAQPQRKLSRPASPQSNGGIARRPSSPARGRVLDAAAAVQQQEQWQQWQQLEGGAVQENELASLVSSMQLSDGPATAAAAGAAGTPGASPRAPPWRSRLRRVGSMRRLGGLLHTASLSLEELLHTKGRSGPRLWLSVAMAPLTLLLHSTMPALHGGTYTPLYALVLALCAPLFTLLSTALYPHHLSTSLFLMVWLLLALGLFVLLLAVPPAAASAVGASPGLAANGAAAAGAGANPLAAAASGSPFGSSARLARLSPGAASSAGSSAIGGGLWARVLQACSWQLRRPRRNVLLAILASLQCMLWMSLAADELVALFQAIGRIVDVSQDMLGATVLAWGEAVPELVATLSLAKSGQATMAIAAVFGGPIFNVLIAWAGPTLYASLRRHEPLPYRLSPGVGILVASTVAVLLFLLAAVPLAFRWRLSRAAAVALLSIYAVSQLLFLLAEGL